MNDQFELERTVAKHISGLGPSPPSDGFHEGLITRASRSRQRPEWLALIQETPMRTDSRITVGSPAVRVAAILAATALLTMSLVAAGIAGRQLLASDGPIIVDQSGGGTYVTISEAIANATDGDEIIVRAGEYAESVTISDAITLRGEDRDGVIVEVGLFCEDDEETELPLCDDGVPMIERDGEPYPYGFLLVGSEATIRDLTFRFGSSGFGLLVDGGAPLIQDVAYDDELGGAGLDVFGGSRALIDGFDADSTGCGCTWISISDGSPTTITDSSFDAVFANTDVGGRATIRDNAARGIFFSGAALVEGNTIISRTLHDGEPNAGEDDFLGINVQGGEGWFVRGNRVTGFTGLGAAIDIAEGSTGTVAGNTLADNRVGISVPDDATIEGNLLTGGETGISVTGGSPTLADNTVEGMTGAGIVIAGATPSLSHNRSCDNGTDLQIVGAEEPHIDSTNEICQDQIAETSG